MTYLFDTVEDAVTFAAHCAKHGVITLRTNGSVRVPAYKMPVCDEIFIDMGYSIAR